MAGAPNLTSLVFQEGDRIRDYQVNKETVSLLFVLPPCGFPILSRLRSADAKAKALCCNSSQVKLGSL
jgi:hypothetical protein